MAAADPPTGTKDPDWATFAALDRMTNHWDRPGWRPGRTAYYWYLSFRDQPEVHALAEQCQSVVAAPHFDLIAPTDLHMTVERVAFAEEIEESALRQVVRNARIELSGFGELRFHVGPLAGSKGALSFSTSPQRRLFELRSLVLTATHCAGSALGVPIAGTFRPHVGIGYCNRTVDARPIIEQVHGLRTLPPVNVCISELALVELTRHERAYSWEIFDRIALQ